MKTLNLFLAVCFFATAGAQNLVRVFDAPNTNRNFLTARSTMLNSRQGIVTVGCTSPTQNRFSGNALIVKTDLSGSVLWNAEHVFNDGTVDVMSNYVSMVEDGGATGSTQYVAAGNAIDKSILLFSMIDPATGNITNSKIITHGPFIPFTASDSILEFMPVKLLYDNRNDQFLCVVQIRMLLKQFVGGGVGAQRVGIVLLDNALNHIQTRIYNHYANTEIMHPVDAMLFRNSNSGNPEVAIIGTASNLQVINGVNPLYNHPAPFFGRVSLPASGGPLAPFLDSHIYPYLYNPGIIEEALNTSFTKFNDGNTTGFYVAAFRAIAIGQTEPFIYSVDDDGVLLNTIPFNSPPPSVASKHEMITSLHYDRQLNSLIMTGGRYESVFNNILPNFNEFWKVAPVEKVYAKSWYLDLNSPSISSSNYGRINVFDSVSWITSSVYDAGNDITYAFGNYKQQLVNDAQGFLFMENVNDEHNCYKEEDTVLFNTINLADTVLSLYGNYVDDVEEISHTSMSLALNDAIDCDEPAYLFKTSPFFQVVNNIHTEDRDVSEVLMRVYDLSGRLLVHTTLAIENPQQAEASIRKELLRAYPDLLKDKIYVVQYQANGQPGRFKLVITE